MAIKRNVAYTDLKDGGGSPAKKLPSNTRVGSGMAKSKTSAPIASKVKPSSGTGANTGMKVAKKLPSSTKAGGKSGGGSVTTPGFKPGARAVTRKKLY